MKQIFLLSLFFLFIGGCTQQIDLPLRHKVDSSCSYYDLDAAMCIDKASLLQRVGAYKVIFVGDHHDSLNAHKIMLTLIEGLSAQGYKVSVANEWFTPQENELLEDFVAGKLDTNSSKALGWKKRVGYDYNLTQEIYDAVIKEGGRLYGINMSKKFKKMISDQNLSGMSAQEKAFYRSLDLNVTAHHQLLKPYFEHCHSHRSGERAETCSKRMYRVQVAWDTMMGEESAKLAERLQANERLIVFIGAMHLEHKLGANLRFARKSNIPFITVLPYAVDRTREKSIGIENGSSDLLYLYDVPLSN